MTPFTADLKTINSKVVKKKTVLLRVDFNVPLKTTNGQLQVADETRLKKALPTLEILQDNQAKVILLSHLGRPGGLVKKKLSLEPVAKKLASLLPDKKSVKFCSALTGKKVKAKLKELESGEILVLENTRFDPREKKNDLTLAKELAKYAEVYINESFSAAHRAHTSTIGVAELLPAYAGLAFSKEYQKLTSLIKNPTQPFVAVIGGAKISGKIEAIRNLTKITDVVLVGGGTANNFIKAEGIEVYKSYLEDQVKAEQKETETSFVEVAFELLEKNKVEKMMLHDYIPLPKIIYPSDVVAAKKIKSPDQVEVINLTNGDQKKFDSDLMFLDIGPKTQRLYREIILQANTVFWNGPMGVFEEPQFQSGTKAIASAVAKTPAETTVGGGDTLCAINQFKLEDRFDYVSAAGGAALELLAGQDLPALPPLIDQKRNKQNEN
jgi:phosphoglycerate kinase